jgi:TolA-binding protein
MCMRVLLAVILILSTSPAFAQQAQPNQLELCNSQNFIISRYLATDEQMIIQLRSSMTQLTDQIANLQKQLEESKGEKK